MWMIYFQITAHNKANMAMMPVKCFTCGKVVCNKYDAWLNLIRVNDMDPGDALDKLGMTKLCCRRMFVSHSIPIEKDLAPLTDPHGLRQLNHIRYDTTQATVGRVYDAK